MLKRLFIVLALWANLPVFAVSPLSSNLSVATSRDVAYISQEVQLTGATTHQFVVAPLAVSEVGLTARKLAQVRTVQPVPAPENMPLPALDTSSNLVRATKGWVAADFARYKDRLVVWLKHQGVSMAYFSYTQQAMVATATGNRMQSVSFVAAISSTGQATYGEPKVIDSDPFILEAVYTPLKVQEGLPETWAYLQAGTLQWRLLDKHFQPTSAWTVLDTGGAYDAPEEEDPTTQIACLAGSQTLGCPAGAPTVGELVNSTGAAMAVMSYRHRLSVAYEPSVANPDESVPKAAYSVDSRTWNCSRLVHEGTFGMLLQAEAEQFAVYKEGDGFTHFKTAEASTQTISPTESYTVSASVADLGGVHPDDVVLVPRPEGGDIFWRKDDPDIQGKVVYMAPLVVDETGGKPTNLISQADIAVSSVDLGNGVSELLVGTVGNNYWSNGQFDRSVTFDLESPDAAREFRLADVAYDDFLLVAINGVVVFNGPFGGDMLEYGGSVTAETYCSQNANGTWTCSNYSPTTLSSCGHWDNPCPANVRQTTYNTCTLTTDWGSSLESYSSYYACSNTGHTCGGGLTQTRTGATSTYGGQTTGCYYQDQRQSRTAAPDVDLRPYLRAGSNTLFMRTVVGGNGEFWSKLRIKACSL